MKKDTITSAGFTLHDYGGDIIAWFEHVDDALRASRRNSDAAVVRRVLDNELIAEKPSSVWRQRADDFTVAYTRHRMAS